ncbi:MAG TPA: hypothetical protein VHB48_06195 [Chitinophagaceae bacterium]|nr:hypothetical protein [Chitinophagaceae bacterium]
MSEEKPYNDELFEQLNNLPLPDEDQAWQEMKTLLDDSGDRRLIPPYLRFAGRGAVAVLLVLLVWFWILPHKQQPVKNEYIKGDSNLKDRDGEKLRNPQNTIPADSNNSNKIADTLMAKSGLKGAATPGITNGNEDSNTNQNKVPVLTGGKGPAESTTGKLTPGSNTLQHKGLALLPKQTLTGGQKVNNQNSTSGAGNPANNNNGENPRMGKTSNNQVTSPNIAFTQNTLPLQQPAESHEKDSTLTNKVNISQETNSNNAAKTDSMPALAALQNKPVINKDSSSAATPAAGTKHKAKGPRFEAGVAEQQAVRLDCNCELPGNIFNNSPSLKDYVPSVYVRWYPGKKWFVQGEFKYNAPQYVKEVLYKQSIQNQPLNYITTSYVLKQVRYNQLLLSFHYTILPGWSIGAGVTFNHFTGGVSQKDVRKKLYGTDADSLINAQVFTGTTDSIFGNVVKNSLQEFIESEYQWKIFAAGLRYVPGTQPYIKYADPFSGKPVTEKTQSLSVFLRVQLWDSKRRKK